VLTAGDYAYGASLIPDEDDMKQTPIRYSKIADPDGNIVQIVESPVQSSIFKVVLNVLDLNDSVEFFLKELSMRLLRKRANIMSIPKEASMCAYVVGHILDILSFWYRISCSTSLTGSRERDVRYFRGTHVSLLHRALGLRKQLLAFAV